MTTVFVRHNRVDLALHTLREGGGRPLLLLHGLGERTPESAPMWAAGWPGPVVGLDFTGHGASTVPVGGGYSCELLMADADAAVGHLGSCTVVGRGLGAYVALILAGARPGDVIGAVLDDGPGIVGGGSGPASNACVLLPAHDGAAPDPLALLELSRDVRPPDYAVTFAHLAASSSRLRQPISVTAVFRPPWLQAVADHPAVAVTTLPDALAEYASA